jgi:hypothetical protein
MKNSSHKDKVVFKIDASRCTLRVGDPVTMDTIIGVDSKSRDLIKADINGIVTGIFFNGGYHELTIYVEPVDPVLP